MWPFRKRESRDNSFISFTDLIGPSTVSGVRVSPSNSIDHPAVYRCVDLNSQTIGSFPVDCMVKRGDKRMNYPEPLWFRKPNEYQDFNALVAEAQASQEMYDSAFLLKATSATGQLVGLNVLDPNLVDMQWVKLGGRDVIVYYVSLNGGKVRLAYNEILHIKAGLPIPGALRGISPTVAARETIGTGMAAREFGARFYAGDGNLSSVIEVPGAMTQEQTERLQEAFKRRHGGVQKSHALGILSGGAQWKSISVSPADSQALPTQKYGDVQIAQLFGIPPNFVTESEGTKGFVTGVYAQKQMWYTTGLYPRITRNERAFSSLLAGGAYIKFRVDSWMRMDPAERTAFYAAGQQGQYLTRNEIRAWEDLNPVEGGDEFLKSVQWQDNAPDTPDAEPDNDEPPMEAEQ